MCPQFRHLTKGRVFFFPGPLGNFPAPKLPEILLGLAIWHPLPLLANKPFAFVFLPSGFPIPTHPQSDHNHPPKSKSAHTLHAEEAPGEQRTTTRNPTRCLRVIVFASLFFPKFRPFRAFRLYDADGAERLHPFSYLFLCDRISARSKGGGDDIGA